MKKVRLFREKHINFRTITNEKFKKVSDNAHEHLKPILLVAINTGMRRCEILGIKRQNVNPDGGYLLVNEAKNIEQGHIPFNEELNELLKSVKLNACSEYVFTHNEKPIKGGRASFNSALKNSGVEKFRFHDLGHTFAGKPAMNGVDIVTVQGVMGHMSLATSRRYSHPASDHKKHAVESLNSEIMDTCLNTNAINTDSESNVTSLNH